MAGTAASKSAKRSTRKSQALRMTSARWAETPVSQGLIAPGFPAISCDQDGDRAEMDASTARRPGVLSARQVGELLAREFSQVFHTKSDNLIEDAWHGGCRIRRKFNAKSLRPG